MAEQQTQDINTWGAVLKLWPLSVAIVGGIVFSVRQEGRINQLNDALANQRYITDHLTRVGEGLKDGQGQMREDIAVIKTVVLELKEQKK